MLIWHYTATQIHTSVGGVEKHILGVTEELSQLGHNIHIGTQFPDTIKRNESLILHTHGDQWPELQFILKFKSLPHAKKWIQVCHGTSVGRILACKEYLSLSGYKGSLRDFLLIHLANAAVAVSPRALEEAKKYFLFSGPSKVIPNGVNDLDYTPLNSITQKPILGFLGRTHDRVKNISTLLEACAEVSNKYQAFELWMAPGDSSFKGSYIKQLGPLYGKNLAAKLKDCRALILCSYYEGDPLVLHEAKALGIPIIVSRIPQLSKTLENYKNVFWIDPHSKDSIVEAIENVFFKNISLIKPTPLLRTWRQVALEYSNFYDNLLKS